MAGYQHDAIGLLRIGSAQHRINIGDFRWFRDALAGLLGETVGLHLQAVAAVFGIAFKLGLDPLPRRSDSLARFDRFLVLRGDRRPVLKADQLFNCLPDRVRGNLPDRLGDARIGAPGSAACFSAFSLRTVARSRSPSALRLSR